MRKTKCMFMIKLSTSIVKCMTPGSGIQRIMAGAKRHYIEILLNLIKSYPPSQYWEINFMHDYMYMYDIHLALYQTCNNQCSWVRGYVLIWG